MALKRSGVRASSAPLSILSNPALWVFSSTCVSVRRLSVSLLSCIFLFLGLKSSTPVHAQSSSAVRTKTDIILFIRPIGLDSANIGLAYSKRVPHALVEREVKRLLDGTGWILGSKINIDDSTVRPDDSVRFPPTTGAMFTVINAPQLHDNAPVLRPYLQAFHAWSRVELLLESPEIQPYNGLTTFHSAALDVQLVKGDGVYSYIADIHDHTGELPSLVQPAYSSSMPDAGATSTPTQQPQPRASVGEPVHSSGTSLFWPCLFIATGAVLTGGVIVYLVARRHVGVLKARGSR